MYFLLFFFFKQKTAYDVRISDWSSDVCSSDLIGERGINARVGNVRRCDAGANWRVAWGNPTAACKPWLLALLKFQQYRTRAWPYRASKSRINTRQADRKRVVEGKRG